MEEKYSHIMARTNNNALHKKYSDKMSEFNSILIASWELQTVHIVNYIMNCVLWTLWTENEFAHHIRNDPKMKCHEKIIQIICLDPYSVMFRNCMEAIFFAKYCRLSSTALLVSWSATSNWCWDISPISNKFKTCESLKLAWLIWYFLCCLVCSWGELEESWTGCGGL